MRLLSGTANLALAREISSTLALPLCRRVIERYAGGELHVELGEGVSGEDVFVLQPTNEPVERNLFELLLLADAAYRDGASSITAVIPYFGYGRQDRRTHRSRMPVGARVVADIVSSTHIARVVGIDLHAAATESFFGIPLEHVTAVPLLIDAVRPLVGRDFVVVAPDLGAAKLAAQWATALDLPMAVIHKLRLSGSAVSVIGLTGDVRGRRALIVDDMVTTGATIEAAAREVIGAGAQGEVVVVVSHSVLEPGASARLDALPLARYVTTDSISSSELPERSAVVGLGALLADVIGRLGGGESLASLLADV